MNIHEQTVDRNLNLSQCHSCMHILYRPYTQHEQLKTLFILKPQFHTYTHTGCAIPIARLEAFEAHAGCAAPRLEGSGLLVRKMTQLLWTTKEYTLLRT